MTLLSLFSATSGDLIHDMASGDRISVTTRDGRCRKGLRTFKLVAREGVAAIYTELSSEAAQKEFQWLGKHIDPAFMFASP